RGRTGRTCDDDCEARLPPLLALGGRSRMAKPRHIERAFCHLSMVNRWGRIDHVADLARVRAVAHPAAEHDDDDNRDPYDQRPLSSPHLAGPRLATSPLFTGSSPLVNTIGRIAVAFLAAIAAGGPPAKIMVILLLTRLQGSRPV